MNDQDAVIYVSPQHHERLKQHCKLVTRRSIKAEVELMIEKLLAEPKPADGQT